MRKILKTCIMRLPNKIYRNVDFQGPEKATTKLTKRIMTLIALHPSMIRATHLPLYFKFIDASTRLDETLATESNTLNTFLL